MFDTYQEIFDARAESYHRAMTRHPHARACEFSAMVEPLIAAAVDSVCDMPSGGGYLRDYLPSAMHYSAIEPTAAFARHCDTARGDRVIQCPLHAVPLPDASFAAIVSLAGLHHEPDKSSIVREMARLVAPGGIAVIADVAAGSREDAFLNGFVDANSAMGHRGHFLDTGLTRLLRDAGLEVCDDRQVAMEWRLASRDDAADFAADLFGISVARETLIAAIGDIVGFTGHEDGVGVNWSLRRLICERRAMDLPR